jgi:hypothetical protein
VPFVLFATQRLQRINQERLTRWEVTGEDGNGTLQQNDQSAGYGIESSGTGNRARQDSIQRQRSDQPNPIPQAISISVCCITNARISPRP